MAVHLVIFSVTYPKFQTDLMTMLLFLKDKKESTVESIFQQVSKGENFNVLWEGVEIELFVILTQIPT